MLWALSSWTTEESPTPPHRSWLHKAPSVGRGSGVRNGPGPCAVPSRLQTALIERFQNSVSHSPFWSDICWPMYSVDAPPVTSSTQVNGARMLSANRSDERFEADA